LRRPECRARGGYPADRPVRSHRQVELEPGGPVGSVRLTDRQRGAELPEEALLVVGVEVRDPGNGGTLIRSAEAAGAHGVIFCRGSVDVTNPKTVRASAGALFHVPVVEGCDPQEVLGVLGDLGLMRIAAVPQGGERPDRVDLSGPLALVFGNEAQGLLKGALEAAGAPAAIAARYEEAAPVHASTLNHAVPEEFAAAFSKPGTT